MAYGLNAGGSGNGAIPPIFLATTPRYFTRVYTEVVSAPIAVGLTNSYTVPLPGVTADMVANANLPASLMSFGTINACIETADNVQISITARVQIPMGNYSIRIGVTGSQS